MRSAHGSVRGGRLAQRGKERSGFTLVETMVALTILAFGLLAMLAMMVAAMQGGNMGRHTTDAARLARDKLEFFYRVDWNDPQMTPGGWQTEPAANTTLLVANSLGVQQEQVYTLQYRVTQDPAEADLRFVDVRVTWREGNDAAVVPNRRVAMSSVRYRGS
jgi:prepilin-type N-terminal cleavage/methylation domain-containing protein